MKGIKGKIWIFLLAIGCLTTVFALQDRHNEKRSKREMPSTTTQVPQENHSNKEKLLDQQHWTQIGQDILRKHLNQRLNTNIAKNIILFMGDGMSLPTVTAARIYQGQLKGGDGEEDVLSFEEFPDVGMAKHYCVDTQVADSSCAATAYLGGVKSNFATIGVSARVKQFDCEAMRNVSNHVQSIAVWAQEKGKSAGFVTTTRITHASPLGFYGHVANRDWEDDVGVSQDGYNASYCMDAAQQLIKTKPGIDLKVIMGGGKKHFYPRNVKDDFGNSGNRKDGQNLIEQWEKDKIGRNESYAYVTTRDQLLSLRETPDYLMGLFAHSHMAYHLDASKSEPTLQEMTEAAIKVLQKNPNGFVLFVEGGKIDLAHHENLAYKSLDETVEFAKAITSATKLTSEEDTLIVVTADHSHVMTLSGYPKKGNSILGYAGKADDGHPFPTMSYANGPGYTSGRSIPTLPQLKNKDFRYPATYPLELETHGADDVGVYALGPWSHLFKGVYEQHFIPHALGFASCIGSGLTACHQTTKN